MAKFPEDFEPVTGHVEDPKVYTCFCQKVEKTKAVTHADYRALEERYERWKKDWDEVHNATLEELAALRVRVGEAEDEAVRSTKYLMSLAARTALLFDASKIALNELQSCQSVIHLHGGFDPAYVEGAQKAMRDLSSALEALK
jgi:hypothetical protein